MMETDELAPLLAAVEDYADGVIVNWDAPDGTLRQSAENRKRLYAAVLTEARKLLQGRDAEIEELEAECVVATALVEVRDALCDRLAEALTKAYDDADRRAQHVGLDMRVERSDALTAWREARTTKIAES